MKFNAKRAVKLAAAPLLLAGLAGCATPFKADVSRFQTQLPAPAGQTFAVVADDPALAGGLEFAQYADYVEAEMAELGYAQAAPETADLLVRLDYGVDNGREKVVTTGFSRRDPFWDPWYGSRFGYGYRPYYRHSAWGYGWYDPFFDNGPDVRSYTIYTSGIDMKIDRRVDGERLFEGKAEAVSRSNRLQYLVPNLVDAMFTDFPGHSGETLRISIAPEDREKKVKRVD
ncbi:DUF4136 domain-containing protein [Croceicoccus naphthovorans]|uniref:Lipoprotein transmembrane n=1 Tax=Croceicoccus naphthovorans TaxID=1348774 RepID=A0A0G3XLF5_9SPHN|nr:DUF4136 domain-containing protein [Croceicoccus naphthovorans]AKM11461.1 lipoprotein transmembrane [Croceicoccus naphthovorans]MBB3991476.1 hypothetical protein [Croceicoccus naphthovorans]